MKKIFGKQVLFLVMVLMLVLSSSQVASATTYPTAWTPMSQYNVAYDNVFDKATKTAFSAAVTSFLTGKTSNAVSLGVIAASAWGTYYFVNGDTERVYYYKSYQYREYAPPTYDSNGNVYPNYEIQKTERTSKNSDWTGGQVTVTTRYSTIVEPWF